MINVRRWRAGPRAWLALCLVAGGAATAFAQDESAVAASPAEQARLKGVEYLKSKQQGDGSWEFKDHAVGITALCTLALIENGTPLYDVVVDKGYRYVRKNADEEKHTYDIALSVVLLSRIGDRQDRGLIKNLGARLLAGQKSSGGWSYTCPMANVSIFNELKRLDRKDEGSDNSNTQFAILGLWVASRHGVPIEDAMKLVAERFSGQQLADGHWSYAPVTSDPKAKPPGASQTMTYAALFSLAVAKATRLRQLSKDGRLSEDDQKSLLSDEVFAKGYQRAGEIAGGVSPGTPRYLLWSMERLGVLLGVDHLGKADWFAKGSDALVKSQQPDGHWPSGWGVDGLCDTSFAVLFLRKANLGSDISRLLAGEPPQPFVITNRAEPPRFDTLQDALKQSKPGDVIRVDSNGPFKFMSDVVEHDLAIQAGFGLEPVFEYQVGQDADGLRLRPDRDESARHMLRVRKANVTLEGLRLKFDPPVAVTGTPWRAVRVDEGRLRMLNCTISEGNRRGMIAVATSGDRLELRNCLIIGGRAAVDVIPNGAQRISIVNSVLYSTTGVAVDLDGATKGAGAEIDVSVEQSVLQCQDAFAMAKLAGPVHLECRRCLFKCESMGSQLLPASGKPESRVWKGEGNGYSLTKWVGAGGKAVAGITDHRGWNKLWGDADADVIRLPITFTTPKKTGQFSHELNAQDWELSEKSELGLLSPRPGIRASNVGPGDAFSRFREEFDYTQWRRNTPVAAN